MKIIEFLLRRPISVCVSVFALCVLGFIGYSALPVALLPDIPVPEINIRIDAPGKSARDIESIAVTPIRRQLLTIDGVETITSNAANNYGNISLRFAYDSDLDVALININEKIYKVTENFPTGFELPKVFRSNATDIPIEYITMTLRSDSPGGSTDTEAFIAMSSLCENVIARRLEQLPGVAMVDIDGMIKKEVLIRPHAEYVADAKITNNDIANAVKSQKVQPVSMMVRDGVFEHTIYIENSLATLDDIANVNIRKNGRLYRLGDICDLSVVPRDETGQAIYMGKRCIAMRVIMQHGAKVSNLKKELTASLNYFAEMYPKIEFSESQDQTEVLNYSIRTLKENFLLSLVLMFIVAFIFMGDLTTPVATAICMVSSLIIGFVAFFAFGISLNILSLSGLILVVGMMIDNILITSENITRHRQSGESLMKSCALGCSEMVTPMLSSTLTTIVVFMPLIFLSDLAGALFFDQAMAITIGLMVSYFVAVLLLPVLFMLLGRERGLLSRINHHAGLSRRLSQWMFRTYDRLIDRVFYFRKTVLALTVLSIPLCYLGYRLLPKSQMPETDKREALLKFTWPTGTSLEENSERIHSLLDRFTPMAQEVSASIGNKSYLVDGKEMQSSNQAEIYIKTDSPKSLRECVDTIGNYISAAYQETTFDITSADNIFDRLFTFDDAPVVVKVYSNRWDSPAFLKNISLIGEAVGKATGLEAPPVVTGKEIVVTYDKGAMEAFNVSYDAVSSKLSSSVGNMAVTSLSGSEYIPVVLKSGMFDWGTFLSETTVKARNGSTDVPLSYLVRISYVDGLPEIKSDMKGVMYPIEFYPPSDAEGMIDKLRTEVLVKHPDIRTDIGGAVMEQNRMFTSLFWIFILAVVMMYFILCVQFESFLQPLVVLAEIPIDVCCALIMLWICGYSFNIMSGIGIIASCGIIVNDSILKLDAINNLIAEGVAPHEAVHMAGRQRIRPIVMTSLTTIIAMIPFFFTSDLGSELQQPLALSMISTLAIGTLVSVFVVPVLYETLILNYRKPAPATGEEVISEADE